jgi:hypothetical protein
LFNQLATVLKCQRTTDTVLHSTPEIRHSKFQEPFQFLQPAQQGAEQDRPLFGSGHQPSTINQEPVKAPFHAQTLAQTRRPHLRHFAWFA